MNFFFLVFIKKTLKLCLIDEVDENNYPSVTVERKKEELLLLFIPTRLQLISRLIQFYKLFFNDNKTLWMKTFIIIKIFHSKQQPVSANGI